ncbi:hypothetical protein H4219_005097 [Mycoemilia scoparia]|uniref:SCP domain-containing protein n=1 Tax=Mycoemilia scoparia TaxID=417184 RepID=A0A9W7ZU76_9FUNG|nr:hypothetical protein H4219_005097 [Mycoemilia scoparia]
MTILGSLKFLALLLISLLLCISSISAKNISPCSGCEKPHKPTNSWTNNFLCALNKKRESLGVNTVVEHTALNYISRPWAKYQHLAHINSQPLPYQYKQGDKLPNGETIPKAAWSSDSIALDPKLNEFEIVENWWRVSNKSAIFADKKAAFGVARYKEYMVVAFYEADKLPYIGKTEPLSCK